MVNESKKTETVEQYIESHKTWVRTVWARHKAVREFWDSNATRVVVLTQGKDFNTEGYWVEGNMKRLYAQDGEIKFWDETLKDLAIETIQLKEVTLYVIRWVQSRVLHTF